MKVNTLVNSTSFNMHPAQRGVGMIEVLVTLFILSIGMLGVASLQFVSSFSNADALNRSQSVLVAQQMSERLRASARMSLIGDGLVVDQNYFNEDIYNFGNLSCNSGASPYNCFCLALPADIPNCNTGQCDASEFATFDAYETSCSAVSANPAVEIGLTCSDRDNTDGEQCSTGSRITITLFWPVENWQNIDRKLNEQCNVDRDEPHDCISLDVVL